MRPALELPSGAELGGETAAAMASPGNLFWGRLHDFQGDVFFVDADGPRHEAAVDELLAPGARVETVGDPSLAIVMPDGTLVAMGGDASLGAQATPAGAESGTAAGFVLQPDVGEYTILAAAAGSGGPRIVTAYGEITLFGGQLGLRLDGGLTAVLMRSRGQSLGSASVGNAWGAVVLDTAHAMTRLVEGTAPTPPTVMSDVDVIDAHADTLSYLPMIETAANEYELQIDLESGSTEATAPEAGVAAADVSLTPATPDEMAVVAQTRDPGPPAAPAPNGTSGTDAARCDDLSTDAEASAAITPPPPSTPAPTAAPPVLTVADVRGDEDQAIAFDIAAHVPAPATISELILTGIPDGATLNLGIKNSATTWTISGADLELLADLTLTPVAGSAADFTAEVMAITIDGAVAVDFLAVTLDPRADTPVLTLSGAEVPGAGEAGSQDLRGTSASDTLFGGGGDDDIAGRGGADVIYGDEPAVAGVVPLDVAAALTHVDGSEMLRIEITGVPTGGALSAGMEMGDGAWQLTPKDLEGLQLTVPAGVDDDFQLSVSTVATDTDPDTGAADEALASGTLDVAFASGPPGANDIDGGGGDDWIDAGAGDDFVEGGGGADTVFGGAGADIIAGGGGADELHGGAGDDTLSGDVGRDILYGGDGDDVLRGGAAADTLFGGDGDDRIIGERGDDLLSGGGGANGFVFDQRSNRDTITDFDIGDVLRFEGP